MKIISKFMDYYDGVQGMGIDQSIVFHRKQYELSTEHKDRVLQTLITKFGKGIMRNRVRTDVNWDLVDGDDVWDEHRRKPVDIPWEWASVHNRFIIFCGKVYHWRHLTSYATSYYHRNFKLLKRSEDDRDHQVWSMLGEFPLDFHHELGEAILLIDIPCVRTHRPTVHASVNPSLKDIGFASVVDPYTAFQELSMFIGGVLPGAHPPMIQTSDEDMKVAKGFGHKYAFKTEPTKRKPK